MNSGGKTYLFHLYRKDGSSLFLHPFTDPKTVVALMEKGPLEGWYGREPRVEALTAFREELHRIVEQGVRKWVDEQRFIPKFLLAAAAFVVTYLFFSIVVRDPLPVIDELVLGVGAAIATFVLTGRRYLAARSAAKKRLDLRLVADRITFRQSAFVQQAEQALGRLEAESGEEVARQIVEPLQQELGEGSREEAAQFLHLLEGRFKLRKLQREERALQRRAGRRREPSSGGTRLLGAGQLDFPLYAVYKRFKRTVAGLK